VSRALTYLVDGGGYRCIDCPQCGQACRVDRHRDQLRFKCYGKCGADVAAMVDQQRILAELIEHAPVARRNGGDPEAAETPAEQLTDLLDLASNPVTGGRVVGRGGSATGYIYLTDGELVFEHLRDMAKPATLMVELAACTGANPRLTQAKAIRAVVLLRELAEHEEVVTIDALSREWGISYLQEATTVDVDMDDQSARWGAFCELERRNPSVAAREEGTSIARASVVLRHSDGTRYVRAGWFRSHVRGEDVTVSPQEIAQRMLRVGWERRGAEGLVKATRPDLPGQLAWRFYIVRPGWEEAE
jgi:hypothetical protein